MDKAEIGYVMTHMENPIQQELRAEYGKAVENMRDIPKSINCHRDIFIKILKHCAESHGELLISDDDKGIYFARDGTPLTNFGAIPLRVIHQFSEDGEEDWVELFIISRGISSKKIKIPAKNLSSAQWIENLGIDYIYEKQEVWSIKVLIQTMAKYAPIREEFLYSGWAPDGRDFYIISGRKLCADDWACEQAKITCNHTWKMLDVAPHWLTFVLLSVAILSLFQSKMVSRGFYFKGVCCITAPTQSFKTTLASLFFDFDQGREADVNFEATTTAIVRTIGNTRDSTVILDDYKPGATKAESNDMLQKISKVVRLCSDDSGGIKKAGVQNQTVTNTARCLVVVTAERIHFTVQSTLARLLVLEMNRKSVDKDKLTYFQANHAMYRGFIEDFIRYISSKGVDAFCERLEQRFLQERNVLQDDLLMRNIETDGRSNDMCVWLNTIFSEFLKYALDIQVITQEQHDNYLEEARQIFISILEQQTERVSELDEVRRFFKGLQVLIETRSVHIGQLQSRNMNYSTSDSKSAIGFRKKDFVYIKNDVAFQKVVSYFQRNGQEFAIHETELRKKLMDRGYINSENGKRCIYRLSVNHESYQCIRFNAAKFDELLRGGRNYEAAEREVSSDRILQENANSFVGR